MAMALGSFASRVVATAVVATDGTGDFTDIQSAIDSLPAGGGVVYIKEGTYTITAKITITSANISIFGAGKGTKIISSGGIRMFECINADNFTVKDIWFYGEGAVTPGSHALYFDSCDNVIVDRCIIENMGTTGINFVNATDSSSVVSCHVIDCGNVGLRIQGTNIILKGNFISGGSDHGIHVFDSSNITITSNIIRNNVKEGMYLQTTIGMIVANNICDDNDSGDTATYSGIKLFFDVDRCIITGNVCINNGDYGININHNSCANNVVTGNTCLNNTTGQIRDVGTDTLPNGAVGTNNLALDDLNYV